LLFPWSKIREGAEGGGERKKTCLEEPKRRGGRRGEETVGREGLEGHTQYIISPTVGFQHPPLPFAHNPKPPHPNVFFANFPPTPSPSLFSCAPPLFPPVPNPQCTHVFWWFGTSKYHVRERSKKKKKIMGEKTTNSVNH